MKLLYILILLLILSTNSNASQALDQLFDIPASALSLVDGQGKTILAKQEEQALIPASTIKIITALMALEHWGRTHRFTTEFLFDEGSKTLTVKGLGDPLLVSEELDVIVAKIKAAGITQINALAADTSHFSNAVNIHAQGKTNNPYDAAASALAANFNTIELHVTATKILSGEPQTPLTPMAIELAQLLPKGKHRINLGLATRSSEYFLQVLAVKLRHAGIHVGEHQSAVELAVTNSNLLFIHSNSKSLQDVVKAMLKYSNNFIANQLFLLLGVEYYAAPASLLKSQRAMNSFIADQFGWQYFVIKDGAGLSRDNLLSAKQLIEVVTRFTPYRALLPAQSPQIFAKSGTLKGVSCYAGFVYRENEWQRFALMINQPVQYRFRELLTEELRHYRR